MYDKICEKCDKTFEWSGLLDGDWDEEVTCPHCGAVYKNCHYCFYNESPGDAYCEDYLVLCE